MRRHIFLLLFLLSNIVYAQVSIQMESYGGVFRIPCKINGAKAKLIFDTGADKVCLSVAMADYLVDNDYITSADVVGTGSTTIADGSIIDHVKIIIRELEIGGVILSNVEASVVDGQDAPLLLGQSAIRRLGTYRISGNTLILEDMENDNDVDYCAMLDDAEKDYEDGLYASAVEKFDEVMPRCYGDYHYYIYAFSLMMIGKYEKAELILKKIDYRNLESEISNGNGNSVLADAYRLMSLSLQKQSRYRESIGWCNKSLKYEDDVFEICFLYDIQAYNYESMAEDNGIYYIDAAENYENTIMVYEYAVSDNNKPSFLNGKVLKGFNHINKYTIEETRFYLQCVKYKGNMIDWETFIYNCKSLAKEGNIHAIRYINKYNL